MAKKPENGTQQWLERERKLNEQNPYQGRRGLVKDTAAEEDGEDDDRYMTLCEGNCKEEFPLDEAEACPHCGTDPLCPTCIGCLDHYNPETGRLCGETADPNKEFD